MKKTTQVDLLNLSSTFSKMVKRRFGKGPESCNVFWKENRMYIVMRNFITPAEEVLVKNQDFNLALKFRSSVMNAVTDDFLPLASEVVGERYDNFFHDWNYDNNTGMILLEHSHSYLSKIDVSFQANLLKLIEDIGTQIHKKPSTLEVVKHTPHMCVIQLEGVLLQIESLLYEKGDSDLLLEQSREIKNRYISCKEQFEEIFNRAIEDIFIMWDYEKDRNYLVFHFLRNM